MSADPLAVRVARRHQAARVVRTVPTTRTRVEYTNSGRISAVELATMLEPQFGYLVRVRFRPTPHGPSTTVAWAAVTEDGAVVSGTLTLRAAVAEDEVTSWAVLTVDPTP
jgi:hypothetical protein